MNPSQLSAAAEGMAATSTTAAVRPWRGWRIVFGATMAVAGLLVIAWPRAILVVVVIFASQLVAAGLLGIVTAFSAGRWRSRVLFLLLGQLFVAIGIVSVISPFRTATILAALVGIALIFGGTIEMFQSFTRGGWFAMVTGGTSAVIGVVVVAYPAPAVTVLTWLLGIALIVIGVVAIARPVPGAAIGRM